MFTGIIQTIKPVTAVTMQGEIVSISIAKPSDWTMKEGESISINGVCSTVVTTAPDVFTVEYMPETRRKTTTDLWKIDDALNLEKSLRVGDSLDGHFVLGHIDTVGEVVNIIHEGDSRAIEIMIPREFIPHVAYK